MVIVCFVALSEVNSRLVSSARHLFSAMAVIMTAMASESAPLTAPPAAKAFVRVLVRFGEVWW